MDSVESCPAQKPALVDSKARRGRVSNRFGLVYVFDNIVTRDHTLTVDWNVDFHDDFVSEFRDLPIEVQDELLAVVVVLERFGPQLGRPRVDTLNGSRHPNMKEMRVDAADVVWRFAFAFDPKRRGIILCGGDKSGGSEKRFYRRLIEKADARYEAHLTYVREQEMKRRKGKQP